MTRKTFADNAVLDGYTEIDNVAIDAATHERLLEKSVRTPVEGYQHTYMVALDIHHLLHCLVGSDRLSLAA